VLLCAHGANYTCDSSSVPAFLRPAWIAMLGLVLFSTAAFLPMAAPAEAAYYLPR